MRRCVQCCVIPLLCFMSGPVSSASVSNARNCTCPKKILKIYPDTSELLYFLSTKKHQFQILDQKSISISSSFDDHIEHCLSNSSIINASSYSSSKVTLLGFTEGWNECTLLWHLLIGYVHYTIVLCEVLSLARFNFT